MTTNESGIIWDQKTLISNSYIDQNKGMHASENFGAESGRFSALARQLIREHECKTILDYGCGKGNFSKSLPEFDIQEYDPAISGKDALPVSADFVICNDVLEHVEPEFVETVLDHLQSLTLKVGLIVIATKYSIMHKLPDGRNPHLSVHEGDWWEEKLKARFSQVIPIPKTRQQEYGAVVL